MTVGVEMDEAHDQDYSRRVSTETLDNKYGKSRIVDEAKKFS